jgi:hypothetical protein
VSRRPSSLFRGSELPRFLFLVAILLAGWPMFVIFGREQAPENPPPPTVPVSKLEPVEPDEGVEFKAVTDKTTISVRESAAYATLLKRARETSAAELASKARRDVFFANLWGQPEHYRGVPIHLEGTAKKILTHEVGPAMSPTGRLYEVWFYSDENRALPYVLTIEDPPTGLVIGYELNLRVTVDGYFFKLLKYQAGDTLRAAPMLVGRMRWTPTPVSTPSPIVEFNRFTKQNVITIVVTMLVAYVLIRVIFQVRKNMAPTRSSIRVSSFNEGVPPEEVADWLQNLPDAETEIDENDPTVHEGPGLRDR